MKKLTAIILALVMVLSFVACGGKKEETAFNAKKAADTLLASEDFKECKLLDAKDIEFEYGITLEDTAEIYFARQGSMSANAFIIAVAKKGSESLMFGEMEKLEKMYCGGWTEIVYDAKEADKVNKRYSSEKDGVYIMIISSDSSASLKLIK